MPEGVADWLAVERKDTLLHPRVESLQANEQAPTFGSGRSVHTNGELSIAKNGYAFRRCGETSVLSCVASGLVARNHSVT
jgi:hypothetical protein